MSQVDETTTIPKNRDCGGSSVADAVSARVRWPALAEEKLLPAFAIHRGEAALQVVAALVAESGSLGEALTVPRTGRIGVPDLLAGFAARTQQPARSSGWLVSVPSA